MAIMPRCFLFTSCLLALLLGGADAFFFSRMPARLQQVQTQGSASRLALFGYVLLPEKARKGEEDEKRGRGKVVVLEKPSPNVPHHLLYTGHSHSRICTGTS